MHSADYHVKQDDFKVIDDLVKGIVKEKQPFERLEMKKADLLEMFKYNEFKLRILKEKVKTETTTVYRCGPLIDLCRGPHVRHTGKIKSMAVTKNSATYWEGNCEAESLQRIYGISFPDNKLMKEWKLFQEEAAKGDHRKIRMHQDLFFFHKLSPGSCFFQPKGAHIYNKLLSFLKEEYWKEGLPGGDQPQHLQRQAVAHLWPLGPLRRRHVQVPDREGGLRAEADELPWPLPDVRPDDPVVQGPAQCPSAWPTSECCTPGSAGSSRTTPTSYVCPSRSRPRWRAASTSSSTSTACSASPTSCGCPEKFLEEIEVWNTAEQGLKESLDAAGLQWKLNEGDGAFYGPKIDITLQLRRYEWVCWWLGLILSLWL